MTVSSQPFYPAVPPISLELTNRCNLKCPYCANGTLTRPSGTIALMNHKDQRLTPGDIDRCHEIFGPAPRIKVNVVETGIMPSARADYRTHRQKVATCSLPNEYFFIAHDGRVALCCSDQDVVHPIGDTNIDSIDEIWFKPSNQAIFRSIGLGLRGCPEFCTAQCHLKTPA